MQDSSVIVTGDNQVMLDLCINASPGSYRDAVIASGDDSCIVPMGVQVQIRDIWYVVKESFGTDEQCKVGLTIDSTGVEPLDFEAWSAADFGDNTTISATCDEVFDDTSAGELRGPGDACHVSDPVGTIITQTDGTIIYFRLLIDEADTGTPNCSVFRGLSVTMKVETCGVPYP